jgi:malate/lactate dehydrogenase
MKTVCVFGTGRLGTRLAEELVTRRICERLLLVNRSRERLRGTLESLQMWASLIGSEVAIEAVPPAEVMTADLVVVAVKDRYDPRDLIGKEWLPPGLPGGLRHIGLLRDLPIISDVARDLAGYSGMVAVVTNPVEVVTSLLARCLPRASVLGLGLTLDAARLRVVAANELGCAVSALDLPLAGEHGGQLVPLKSLWRCRRRPIALDGKVAAKWLERCRKIGFEIVEDLGYTLQDCAVVFSDDISWFLGRKALTVQRSFALVTDGVAVGWPVRKSGEGIIKRRDLRPEEARAIGSARSPIKVIVDLLAERFAFPIG